MVNQEENMIITTRKLYNALNDMVRYLDHNNKETDVSELAREALNETTLLFRKPDFIEWCRMVRFCKED